MASNLNPFGHHTPAAHPAAGNQPATAANGAAANGASAAADDAALNHIQEPLIDLDDPLLVSESLTAKEGDAFADPPPPPDAIYRCKLSLRGVSAKDIGSDVAPYSAGNELAAWVPERAVDKKTGAVLGAFAKTIINVQIFDPKHPQYEGIYLQVPFKWTDTRENRQGLSRVMTILMLLKQPSGQPWVVKGQRYGHRALMELFVKALAGEPEVLVRSEWSWNCDVCSQEGKKTGVYAKSVEGMHKFPQPKIGVYSPEMVCQVNKGHGYSKARATAAQYFAVTA
jgi:hypothetical protein